LYHQHHQLYTDDLPFWQDLAATQGAPILELGCGTGRVLVSIAQAGHAVVGLDRDPKMLSIFLEKIPSSVRQSVSLLLADMRRFRLAAHFPLIILPCNTLSEIPRPDLKAFFSVIKVHLSDEGVFAASLLNPALIPSLPADDLPVLEDIIYHPFSENPVQVSSIWTRQTRSYSILWFYDHMLPNGQVERFTMQSHHTLTTLEEYEIELRKVGLCVQAVYGDFEGAIYTTDSPHLILVIGLA
jgi:ubiquinone/menaquinone biosynthesis C-methylase UbiE